MGQRAKSTPLTAAFGRAVRARREELRLSQEDLAGLSDLHRTYVSSVERGTRNVGLENIVALARALRLTPSSLLTGIE